MAVVALSPWPTTPVALANATARLKAAVQGAAADSDERAAVLGAAASAAIERYAPGAPQAVRDEATVRMAGYLAQSDFGSVVKESIGPQDVEYAVNHANAFRNSGAAGLLSRWRVRRAGAVG